MLIFYIFFVVTKVTIVLCKWVESLIFLKFWPRNEPYLFYFDLFFGSLLTFLGPNGLFFVLGKGSNTVLGSTHVVEKLSFSMFSSILIFDFDLILVPFLAFLGH